MSKNLFLITLALILSSCVLGNAKSRSKKADQIQPSWQQKMHDHLAKSQNDEAWGIFSESGYEDRGQVMVYHKHSNKYADAHIVGKAEKKITAKKRIEGKTWTDLKATVKDTDKLDDYNNNSFDGIRYEYIKLSRENGKITTTKRIFMNNPGSTEPIPKHVSLVEAFYGLAK